MAVILLSLFMTSIALADSRDFTSTLRQMIEKDPEFKEVDFRTDFYEAQVKRDFSRLVIPTVNLSYGKYEQHNPATEIREQDTYYAGSLTAALDVFSFGRDWSFYKSSRYELKAQENRTWSKLMEREFELGNLLLSYMREVKNLSILKSIVELKERALKISGQRFQSGALPEQDLNKVKLDVSNARGEYLIALQDLTNFSARIRAFGVESTPELYPWEMKFTEKNLNDLLAMNIPVEKVPQFQELALQYEANVYRQRGFLQNMFGSVQLSFSRSYLDYGSEDQWEWRAGLAYTIPLFDQFRQYTDYKDAAAEKRTSEIQQQFRKNLLKESQVANKNNLKVAFENYRERKEALQISSKLYNDSVRQFNRGQLSVNELLVDQDRLLRTEQIANQSMYQLHLSVLNYCHAYGRPVIKNCF